MFFVKIASLFFFCASLTWGQEIKDALGTRVQLSDHPQRIVTLAPSLGELVADLLGERLDRIVGVSEYTDYPPRLKKVSLVGPYTKINLEKVVSLKPDLILATSDGNSKDQVEHLREIKLPVVVVRTENFSEVSDSIRLVAEALGERTEGKRMVAQFEQGIKRFRDKAKGRNQIKVLLQLSDTPLIVAGRKSFLNDAVQLLGARNIYEDTSAHYPRPSFEDAVHRNPDVIAVLALGSDPKPFESMAKRWNQFTGLKAVQTHRIYVIQGDSVLRPTLRLLEGLSLLEKTLYEK